MRKIGAREVALCCVVVALASSACVTRGVAISERTLESLRQTVESGPTPGQKLGPRAKKNSETIGYVLHASGRVRCGGLISKKQTTYVHAWTTHPGPGGDRVDVPSIKVSFEYLEGLFAGAKVEVSEQSVEEATASEAIRGVGDICTCVYAVSDAMLINTTRVQVREKICPE